MTNEKINITGVAEKATAPIIGEISKKKEQVLVITSSENRARQLAEDLSFFSNKKICILPDSGNKTIKFEAKSKENLMKRLSIAQMLCRGDKCIVIAPVLSAIKKMMPHIELIKNYIQLTQGTEIDLEKIKDKLIELGYERNTMVTAKGQFDIRGGILDVFVPDVDNPYRIELFGDEIESIRQFDIETQRSINNLESIKIIPAEEILIKDSSFQNAKNRIEKEYTKYIKKIEDKYPETADKLQRKKDELVELISNAVNIQFLEGYLEYFYDNVEYIWNYMSEGTIVVDNPDRVNETLKIHDKEIKIDGQTMLERGEIIPLDAKHFENSRDYSKLYDQESIYFLTPFPKRIKGVEELDRLVNVNSRQMLQFNGQMDMFVTEVKNYAEKKYQIHFVFATKDRIENIRELIEENKIQGKISYEVGSLSGGVDFPENRICYITDSDVFAYQKRNKKKRYKKQGKTIAKFSDLQPGDYVVHEVYGIGKFLGIDQMKAGEEVNDYIKIKYAGTDSLYIPVDQLGVIQKYIGSEGKSPKLNKLYDGKWQTTKKKAREAIEQIAQELVELYAKRSIAPGYAFEEDTTWQEEFENTFPYEETNDQIRSIHEVKKDMEKPEAMDRLLCGDVGYGKTEVAARAIFKCLVEGKQAAILVPTTILANQHYYTLKERFERFPFKVEMLSRFRTKKQQEEIVKGLSNGSVDLVIGTHRLLSDDVNFKDLGLLVVDEEQRFGVKHKEKIKTLKENVDVLTLSATPIPRTLNMSLTGIKEISVIEEPPEDRYPVQTYVLEQSEEAIGDIIKREINRGGQVFVVNNNIQSIHRVANTIQKVVPNASIAIGHGRMSEEHLEDIIMDFVNGKIDVLVATTIIENGIDIPNANTIIVLDADKFGLSQLYQLRGRVGRSNVMAFAYFMHQKDKVLTEIAEKRLKAMKDFTEFGAGFKIAMKDLEFRGAGNLLGNKQSGHMANIGYELYCKMMEETVKKLKGEEVIPQYEETIIDLDESAYIPKNYIHDDSTKLQMYMKISLVSDEESQKDVIDELADRFGEIPSETMKLIEVSRIRSLASRLMVKRVSIKRDSVVLEFDEKSNIAPEGIANVAQKFESKVSIFGSDKLQIKLKSKEKFNDTIELLETLI